MAVRRWGLRNVVLSGGVASIAGFFAATQDAIDPSQHYGGFLFVGGTPVGSIALTVYFSIYFLTGMAVAMHSRLPARSRRLAGVAVCVRLCRQPDAAVGMERIGGG